MEPIPAFLRPAFEDVANGTPEGDQILRHAARLAALPEDQALRLAYLGTLHDNRRDWSAAGWLILHPEHRQEGAQAA